MYLKRVRHSVQIINVVLLSERMLYLYNDENQAKSERMPVTAPQSHVQWGNSANSVDAKWLTWTLPQRKFVCTTCDVMHKHLNWLQLSLVCYSSGRLDGIQLSLGLMLWSLWFFFFFCFLRLFVEVKKSLFFNFQKSSWFHSRVLTSMFNWFQYLIFLREINSSILLGHVGKKRPISPYHFARGKKKLILLNFGCVS